MVLLDGREVASQIKKEIAAEVDKIRISGAKIPHLAAVIVGSDGASETYVAHKARACDEVGFKSTVVRLEEQTTEDHLLEKIDEINGNADIDGMIVQLPLPGHIEEQRVIERISADKDVDGFHPVNVGKMFIGRPSFLPATPCGILELLKRYEIETSGRHCVIIGRSNIVGKPMAALMSRKGYPGDATVTLCHSRTRNLEDICRQADILVAALGSPQFVTGNMVKEGAVVIDVGISRVVSGETRSGWKLIGDVRFDEVAPKCSHITPVPGGVGPMTIVALLTNTLKAAGGKTGS